VESMTGYANEIYQNAVDEGYRTEIKSQVQSTIAVLQSEYDKAQAGEKTEEQAKKDAKEIIRIMRYRDDQSGYFWIDDTDYILVMHPVLSEQEGNNRYELEDQDGVMIIQSIMKVCQSADKGGYNQFSFTKADGVTVAPKVAYSEIFEPWGWVVSTGNYVDDMQVGMDTVQAQIGALTRGLLIRIGVVSVVIICVALVLAFLYGTQMVKPLKEIQEFARHLAEGNLTWEVHVKAQNEIGLTGELLGAARRSTRKLLQDITEVANGVSGALKSFDTAFNNMKTSIDETSTAVNSIAGNVGEQASATDNAAGEVSVMAEHIERTDEEIKILDENAKDMKRLSEQSMNTLNNLIKVNDSARENITAMARQSEATNQAVEQIEMAANLINEIADQTNLLALNASIEAARAGESGRGFAVVADEIGKLANQSASSVEEIRRVIEELLVNTSKSVQIMKEMNKSVDVQVSSLSETYDTFKELYHELDNCVNAVQTIGAMTGEIENQRTNVTQSLDLLNNLAQDNAAVAEETSAMTGDVSHIVDSSNQIVLELENQVQALLVDIEKFIV
ncbi:MAG: methyl-accepting chemotaxis protein, partial [Lachnospiraceae bacterium]|nr:methyl-accepting chemotaxis protein [Lachnospiraceae bacterium]